jgi:2-amino-4-hydroxy-6-hydroxymethyldihydropteridine diphosphokinase
VINATAGRLGSGWETVHIGLGSNLGDRPGHLQQALFALAHHPEIAVVRVSRYFETAYQGPGQQDPFVNACAELRTSLAPRVLLAVLQGVERRHGRPAGEHMQPRTLDLDILLFGDRVDPAPGLTLPHPRIRERAFVLIPLAEIAGQKIFPDSGETIAEACAKIRRKPSPWIRVLTDQRLLPLLDDGHEEEWRAALAVHCR